MTFRSCTQKKIPIHYIQPYPRSCYNLRFQEVPECIAWFISTKQYELLTRFLNLILRSGNIGLHHGVVKHRSEPVRFSILPPPPDGLYSAHMHEWQSGLQTGNAVFFSAVAVVLYDGFCQLRRATAFNSLLQFGTNSTQGRIVSIS